MICGIADTDVISDGYLVLPAEGCSGIRASAFAEVSEPITEIYIPANITRIEEGSFCVSQLSGMAGGRRIGLPALQKTVCCFRKTERAFSVFRLQGQAGIKYLRE